MSFKITDKAIVCTFQLDDFCDDVGGEVDASSCLILVARRVGLGAIAEWLAKAINRPVNEILGCDDGGIDDWWGPGSVFFYEMGLSLNIRFPHSSEEVIVTVSVDETANA